MPTYTRAFVPGGTFFFTVVTNFRRPILVTPASRHFLRTAIEETRARYPFTSRAFVLLPDHLHCIWTLPDGDADFSVRWRLIKSRFSILYRNGGGAETGRSRSRQGQRERGIWQRRFWEHTVRDERDYEAFCDYIHYNPVKHDLVKCPHDWPFTSFHRAVRLGRYPMDWACTCEGQRAPVPDFERIMRTIGE